MKYLFILLSLFSLVNCTSQNKSARSAAANGYTTTPSGLKYKILQKGSGAQAKAGQEVLIRETTTYLDGTVLYTNETTGSPVKVLIGGNQATTAVDEGLRGMQTGEIRLLIATPDLVRRKSYPQNVSPDSSLAIKIILHKIL
ncbi:MAG: hypothetical protein RLZZ316_880 [Bacteroidota bacterium]|jgi:FKBP-type peptidyl-prolyl cis-trans isomerase